MLKKKLNPRGPKKRKLVMSLQTCVRCGGVGGGQASSGREGLGQQVQGAGRPHLELPEHEVRVEVELERTEEFQLLRNQEILETAPRPTHPGGSGRGGGPIVTLATPGGGYHGGAPPPRLPAHHGGGGEDAGRGVRPRHRRHLQEFGRQPLPRHGRFRGIVVGPPRSLNPPPSPAHPPSANPHLRWSAPAAGRRGPGADSQ